MKNILKILTIRYNHLIIIFLKNISKKNISNFFLNDSSSFSHFDEKLLASKFHEYLPGRWNLFMTLY